MYPTVHSTHMWEAYDENLMPNAALKTQSNEMETHPTAVCLHSQRSASIPFD